LGTRKHTAFNQNFAQLFVHCFTEMLHELYYTDYTGYCPDLVLKNSPFFT
jgi:hypothetical protein